MSATVASERQAYASPKAEKALSGLIFHSPLMVAGSAMSVRLEQKNCVAIRPIRFDDAGMPVALNGKSPDGWLIIMKVRNAQGHVEELQGVKLNHEVAEVQYL